MAELKRVQAERVERWRETEAANKALAASLAHAEEERARLLLEVEAANRARHGISVIIHLKVCSVFWIHTARNDL